MGKKEEARLERQDAIAGTPDCERLDDFELGWMERAARLLQDTALCERIKQERKRKANSTRTVMRQGELPEVVGVASNRT